MPASPVFTVRINPVPYARFSRPRLQGAAFESSAGLFLSPSFGALWRASHLVAIRDHCL
jgi:hypothetical protein